jgi:hypothetical protein
MARGESITYVEMVHNYSSVYPTLLKSSGNVLFDVLSSGTTKSVGD